MRKLSVLVCALSSAVLGLTDLAVTPDTVRIGDTITVTGVAWPGRGTRTESHLLQLRAEAQFRSDEAN